MKRTTLLSLPMIAIMFLLPGCIQQIQSDPRTISIVVTVPDPAWAVTIREVYVKDERLLVVSSLHRDPEVMAPQVISKTSDSIHIPAPAFPVEHYVLGRTFGWAQEPHQFIADPAALDKILESAERIYRRPNL